MPKKTFNLRLKSGTRELHFDNVAFYEFEDLHGESLVSIMRRGDIGFRALNHMIYVGLLHDERRTSLKEVLQEVDSTKMEEIADVVMKAVNHALGEDEVKNSKSGQQG